MSFDIVAIKAWMASHVFLTIAIVVVLTLVIMMVATDTLKNLHLRLFQAATACLVGLAVSLIVYGSNDMYLVTMGAGVLLATAVAFFAGTRMRIESAQRPSLADVAKAQAMSKRH